MKILIKINYIIINLNKKLYSKSHNNNNKIRTENNFKNNKKKRKFNINLKHKI